MCRSLNYNRFGFHGIDVVAEHDTRYPSFHLVAKPTGSLCNLDCEYCYYLEKEKLYAGKAFRMQPPVLRSFIKQYIEAQDVDDVHFLWQGGEPTLLGLEYFQQIVEIQKKYQGDKRIHNSLQTNGVLLDEAWYEFLRDHHWLVGISIDGPEELHDAYRVTKGGGGSYQSVVIAIEQMIRHDVQFNALTVVHAKNVEHPLAVYEHLRSLGVKYIQFLPVVERWVENTKDFMTPVLDTKSQGLGSNEQGLGTKERVTPWTVNAKAYGEFLIAIFDQWWQRDVGQMFVQIFDTALESWMGLQPSLCLFRQQCGNALAIERNGDIYACDHFVFPEYYRGNIQQTPLLPIVESPAQREFGRAKETSLPRQCQRCDVLFACRGECPKNRFLTTAEGDPNLNYLCEGYLAFFQHIDPAMKLMAGRLLASARS